jgi:hypothetical protein
MESFAIVIGVDRYDPRIGKLESAVSDALGFAAWATRAGRVPVANLRLLLEPDPDAVLPALPPGVAGFSPVSRRKIKETIRDLGETLPAEGGERLYFYYAGHGASFPEKSEDPLFILPEFVDREIDDEGILPFKDLLHRLGALAFREQICLIDACRDFGLPEYELVTLSGVRRRLAERKARQYVLYSVSAGQRAAESEYGGGIWTRVLLDALEGRDYRAVIPGGTAQSPFEIRLDHLASLIRRDVETRTGRMPKARHIQMPEYDRDRRGDNPLLAVFTEETVPQAKLRVFVDPPLAHQTCKVSVMLYVPGWGELLKTASPPPPLRVPVGFELFPLSYSIRAEAERFVLASRGWTVLDDPLVRLTLEKMPPGSEYIPLPLAPPDEFLGGPVDVTRGGGDGGLAQIERGRSRGTSFSSGVFPNGSGALLVSSPDAAAWIEVLDARRKVVHQAVGSFELGDVQPGIYRVRLHLPGAEPSEETVEVRPGATAKYVGGTQARMRLASRLSLAAFTVRHPGNDFLARPHGGRVLALVGVGGEKTPEELSRFLEECRVSLRYPGGPIVETGGLEPLPGLGAAGQRSMDMLLSGALFMELRMPGLAPTRFAIATLWGQLTVLVAVAEADGTIDVRPILLPSSLHSRRVDEETVLRRIRTWDLAQSFYAAGDPDLALAVSGRDEEDSRLNPLLGCLVGYSLVQAGEDTETFTSEALPGLLESFSDLPDLHVLAGLCDAPERRSEHFANALRRGLPIFSQGLRALADGSPEKPPHLAEALASLIPGSPWTAWIARAPW